MKQILVCLVAVFTMLSTVGCGKSSSKLLEDGLKHLNGIGVEPDAKIGFSMIRQSAEKGNADAMVALSDCYRSGKGVEEDLQKAEYWLNLALKENNSTAKLRYAEQIFSDLGRKYTGQLLGKHGSYYTDNDKEQAKQAIQLLIEVTENQSIQSNILAEAYRELGESYYFGYGIQKSKSDALRYYKFSAVNGDAYSAYMAGAMLCDEKNRNYDVGVPLLQQSIGETEVPYKQEAYRLLGMAYTDENWSGHDIKKGIEYIEKAINEPNDFRDLRIGDALCRIGKILVFGDKKYRNLSRGFEYLEKASEAYSESHEADYLLGLMYKDGLYVGRDKTKASDFFSKAKLSENKEIAKKSSEYLRELGYEYLAD